MLINGEVVAYEPFGKTFEPSEDNSTTAAFDPPKLIIACHQTPKNLVKRGFSQNFKVEYDEISLFPSFQADTSLFLGGYKAVFDQLDRGDISALLGAVDNSDPAQAKAAMIATNALISSPASSDESESYSNFILYNGDTNDTSTDSSSVTSTTMPTTTTTTTTTTTARHKTNANYENLVSNKVEKRMAKNLFYDSWLTIELG